MEELPSKILRFAAPLRHPAALSVLLALEEMPRGSSELADLLQLKPDTVEYVVRTLIKAELIEYVRVEPTHEQAGTTRRIYSTCHVGWENVLKAFSELKPRPAAAS